MTFNSLSKKDSEQFNYVVLNSSAQIITDYFNQIETNFLQFIKYYNDIKEFNRKIPSYTKREYEKTKNDVHYKLQLIPTIINTINRLTEKINLNECDTFTIEKLNKIKDNLSPKVVELPNLINQIYEREKIASLKLKNIKLSESKLDDSLSFLQLSRDGDKVRESRIILQEVKDNQEYLQNRQAELEEIKKISNQLKEITVMMGEEVKKQGEQLNIIDEDIQDFKDNTLQGESDIEDGERESRRNFIKFVWMMIGFVVIIVGVIMIVVFTII